MLPVARWSLRVPRPGFRTFATRNTPQGARGSYHRSPVPPRLPSRSNKPSAQPENRSPSQDGASKVEAVSNALAQTPDAQNSFVTPVYIPEDPHAVLKETHPAMRLLDNSAILVQRQLEMMNVLMGFEQANRYVIMDPHGNHIGYLAEQEHGIGNAVARQMFRTHRSFTTHVFDREEKEVLRFHRPFSYINSRIRVYDAVGKSESAYTSSVAAQLANLPLSDMRIIGSAEQEWGLLRRKYNLFLARRLDHLAAPNGTPQLSSGELPLSNSKALQVVEGDSREVGMMQFARVDEPFMSWDFSLKSEDGRLIGSVNRNFAGFARELFTDTGVYALRMDAAGVTAGEQGTKSAEEAVGMTLDQRAVMLATAVSIDFDYFSRHSGSGGFGLWPMWLPWGGEATGAAGAAGAGEAGAVGAASESGIASEAGTVAQRYGYGEGAAAGAGTLAGYEAMQRARESQQQGQETDSQSPLAPEQQPPNQTTEAEDVWGTEQDPWAQNGDNDPWGGGGASGGDGGGGGDGGFGDWFG